VRGFAVSSSVPENGWLTPTVGVVAAEKVGGTGSQVEANSLVARRSGVGTVVPTGGRIWRGDKPPDASSHRLT